MSKKYFVVVLIFIAFVVIMTYPLCLRLNTAIPGFFSTDETYATLWNSWRIKHSFFNHLSLRTTELIVYPFGMDLYRSEYFSYLWLGLDHFLSILTNATLNYNLQATANLFLNGIFVYLLVFYLTRSNLSGVLSGVIFALCPYELVRIWQHLGLSYTQWIVLALLGLIVLKEKPGRKGMLLFLVSLLFLFSFDYTIMYLGILPLAVFLGYSLIRRNTDSKYLKKVILTGIIAMVLLLPQFIPIIKNRLKSVSQGAASAHNPYHRAFEDLFTQSARPLSYFLPAIVHPLFGGFTEQFIGSQLYGMSFTEHTLYLGWVPLILAFVAIRRWKKRRKIGTVPSPSGTSFGDSPYHKEDFYIGFFIFLAVVAWLFSQPPWWNIFGFKIYMPSFFMYKILPMFRAYCRFGIVLMLAIAVLAGFGLKSILERFKSQKVRLALTCLLSGLVLFEFWNWPPYKVIDVSKVPAVYYWLKEQSEDFAVAEYPLDADSPNEMYKFYQTKHEKKIINGTIPGTYANKVAQSIRKLSQPETTRVLKWMGVKYVLAHRQDYIDTGLVDDREELNRIPQNSGLKFIKTFPAQECPQKDIMCVQKTGPIDVYEIVALPIEPKVTKYDK